jgi:hypothetical protein
VFVHGKSFRSSLRLTRKARKDSKGHSNLVDRKKQ